jgi:hypothetical protein
MKHVDRMLLMAFVTAVIGIAQTRANPFTPSVESLMSAAEFQQAGLQKLSPNELVALNRWLAKFANTIAAAVGQTAGPGTVGTPDVVESHIDGDFEGWSGDTTFKLDNGQIWQQAGYGYSYHYAYHPSVTIRRTGTSYRMKIEGTVDSVAVKRLK